MTATLINCNFINSNTNLIEEAEWVINKQCLEQIELKNPSFHRTIAVKDLENGFIYYLCMTINTETLEVEFEDTTNGNNFGTCQIEFIKN